MCGGRAGFQGNGLLCAFAGAVVLVLRDGDDGLERECLGSGGGPLGARQILGRLVDTADGEVQRGAMEEERRIVGAGGGDSVEGRQGGGEIPPVPRVDRIADRRLPRVVPGEVIHRGHADRRVVERPPDGVARARFEAQDRRGAPGGDRGLAGTHGDTPGAIRREHLAFEHQHLGGARGDVHGEFGSAHSGHGERCLHVEAALARAAQEVRRAVQHVDQVGALFDRPFEDELGVGAYTENRLIQEREVGAAVIPGSDRVPGAIGVAESRGAGCAAPRRHHLDVPLYRDRTCGRRLAALGARGAGNESEQRHRGERGDEDTGLGRGHGGSKGEGVAKR